MFENRGFKKRYVATPSLDKMGFFKNNTNKKQTQEEKQKVETTRKHWDWKRGGLRKGFENEVEKQEKTKQKTKKKK